MLTAVAQITCKTTTLYNGLNVKIKLITKNSTNINHTPRFIKKKLSSFFVFLTPYKYAEVPARKTKTGAQKWVIHLVKNNWGVVVARFVGASVDAVM